VWQRCEVLLAVEQTRVGGSRPTSLEEQVMAREAVCLGGEWWSHALGGKRTDRVNSASHSYSMALGQVARQPGPRRRVEEDLIKDNRLIADVSIER
jgi:hypothetical protein